MQTPPPSLNSLSHRTIENPGIWYKNWSYINSCISDFVSNSYNQDVFIVGCTIRELSISRGEEHCLFNMYELEELIEFLST